VLCKTTKEFDEYLKCGRFKHGFLRVRRLRLWKRLEILLLRCPLDGEAYDLTNEQG
jgi:hypothetical protein